MIERHSLTVTVAKVVEPFFFWMLGFPVAAKPVNQKGNYQKGGVLALMSTRPGSVREVSGASVEL